MTIIFSILVFLLPVEIGFFHRVGRKAFWGPMNGRMRCNGKIYWSINKRLSPGAQCLIHDQVAQLCPTVEEVLPCLHQGQKKGQGPEILHHYLVLAEHQRGFRS